MSKNFLAQIVFNQARHDDDCLAHQKKKAAHQQSQHQHHDSEIQKSRSEVLEYELLIAKSVVQVIQADIFDDHVQSLPDYLWLQCLKIVGNENKQDSQQKAVPVCVEVFI